MTNRDCQFPISYFLLKKGGARLRGFDSQSAIGNRQSAFSFIEVLFAVILLGIGFIMIAGIFPVAMLQTATVSNETQGSAVIRDAIKKIQAVADAQSTFPPPAAGASNSMFQPTLNLTNPAVIDPTVQAFSPNVMQALGSDSFFTGDHRFGWVGFYRRDSATSPFAEVFVIALQNPNFPNYVTRFQPGETIPISPPPPIFPSVAPPIPPFLFNYASPSTYTAPSATAPTNGVTATISGAFTYDPTAKLTTVNLSGFSPTGGPNGATGAFVIVADTNNTAPNMVGHIFRLGAVPPNTTPTSTTQTFYLQPGSDITDADIASGTPSSFTATVFVIGNAPTVGASGEYTGPFTGPNQDIAAGSAFIRVNTSNN